MKILVLPDIHGRKFWKEPCKNIDQYDKVIFLGDYLDPYKFENITIEDAMANFEEIIDFANAHKNKVVMLLGNHDMPYYSSKYKSFSMWHCRHAYDYAKDIEDMFDSSGIPFKIAHVEDNILFTHAGVTPGWLKTVFTEQYELTSLDDLAFSLNNLLNTDKGLQYLYMISKDRGGRDRYASCIWADVSDTMWYQEMMKNPEMPVQEIMKVKQVFGHTLQAFYKPDGGIGYGNIIEEGNNKMLDNGNAYELNTESFTINKL